MTCLVMEKFLIFPMWILDEGRATPRTNRLKRYGTTFGCNQSLTVKCINLSLYKVKISVYDAWIET